MLNKEIRRMSPLGRRLLAIATILVLIISSFAAQGQNSNRESIFEETSKAVTRYWTPHSYAYEGDMHITGYISANGEELEENDRYEVGCFIEGNCRNSAILQYISPGYPHLDYIFMLAVMGNPDDNGKLVSFKVYDHVSEIVYEVDYTMSFQYEISFGVQEPLEFEIVTAVSYDITVNSSSNGSVTSDKDTAIEEETVTLTIAPAQGYILDDLSVYKTGETSTTVALSGTGNTRTFSMPAYNVTVNATFERDLDAEAVALAKMLLGYNTYTIKQSEGNTISEIQAWLVGPINQYIAMSGITVTTSDITVSNLTPAIAGTSDNTNGTNGSYDFSVVLTKGEASDVATKTGNVITATVYEILISNDATLSNITLSTGTLTPTFSPTVTNYTVSVPYEVTEITVTAIPNHPNASVYGDGTKTLSVGSTMYIISVMAEDGETGKIYRVNVTREEYAISTDATLSNLTVSEGTLTPSFDPENLNYTVSVAYEVEDITITAIKNHSAATIVGDGLKENLIVGANPFEITVTAEDETTTLTYNVVVTREAYVLSNDATLSDITLSAGTLTPIFSPTVTNYTVSVPYEVTEITVTAIPNHPGADVYGDGTKTLSVGSTMYIISVMAEDDETGKIYRVNVTREAYVISTDATLSDLTVSDGTLTPSFDPENLNYTVSVAYEVENITITAIKNHSAATLVGDGLKENLIVGANPFAITVTAEDETTTLTYNIVVTREAYVLSNDATLSDITLSAGTLTPTFSPTVTSYTVSVPYEVAEITVTAIPNHPGAEIFGDGAKSLSVGSTMYPITVIAEDNESMKVYRITVTREAYVASTDATLSGLTVSEGILNPEFNSATLDYTVT
ncbi:cadherin-like beta sandwich domain-containing protein, partial [Bacteroidales bacterium OttesenSCG-928-K22]|nr:cadherin-like beta sandwich domain-containing protein [Bacteroidales bacterium OttesenSCG-928-K22]